MGTFVLPVHVYGSDRVFVHTCPGHGTGPGKCPFGILYHELFSEGVDKQLCTT